MPSYMKAMFFALLIGAFSILYNFLALGLTPYTLSYSISYVVAFVILFGLSNLLINVFIQNPILLIPSRSVLLLGISYYFFSFMRKLAGLFSATSLYALNNQSVISKDSTFLSRMFTYMLPEAIFLATFISLVPTFIAFHHFPNIPVKKSTSYLLSFLLFIMIVDRFLSSSANAIATVLLLGYFMYTLFSMIAQIPSLDQIISSLLKRFFSHLLLSKSSLFQLSIGLIFIFSLVLLSFNRSGDYLYLFSLPFLYLESLATYTSSIFSYFTQHSGAYCGLQSNMVGFLLTSYDLNSCLAAFRSVIQAFPLYRQGYWLGLTGAHAIDYGSFLVIPSIIATSVCYSAPFILLKTLRRSSSVRSFMSFQLSCFYMLSMSSLFIEFITANLLIPFISLLFTVSLIYLGQLSPCCMNKYLDRVLTES